MSDAGGDNGCDELYVKVGRVIWYLVSTLAMAFAAGVVYIYYLKKGQFEKIEEVKYQLFHEDD